MTNKKKRAEVVKDVYEPNHVSHHADCGCLSLKYEIRIKELETALAAEKENVDRLQLRVDDLQSEKNVLIKRLANLF